jgi:hypothetical protein
MIILYVYTYRTVHDVGPFLLCFVVLYTTTVIIIRGVLRETDGPKKKAGDSSLDILYSRKSK